MGTTEDTEGTENTENEKCDTGPSLVHGELTSAIRQAAFDVHCYFGCGFLEKVYENSLANRLRKGGYRVASQKTLLVRDADGTVVGEYVADLLVEGVVLIEVKAVSALVSEHKAQLLNYLKATGVKVGLLVNFGSPRLQLRRLVN